MATTTTNLSLRKPESADTVSVALDIAGNMQTIDDKWASSAAADIGAAAAAGSALTVARTDHVHRVASGTVSAPGLPVGESNTGLYRPGTGQLAATVSGALAWLTSATGIALEAAMSFKHIATPAAPSAGYLKLYAKSDNKLYKQTPAGSEIEIFDAATTALPRINRLVNGSMRVAQKVALDISTTVVDNTYQGVDRWRSMWDGGGTAPSIEARTGFYPTPPNRGQVRMLSGGTGSKFGVFQVLEARDCADLAGRAVSLSLNVTSAANITDFRAALLAFTGTEDAVTGDPVSAWNASGTNPTLAANWAFVNTPANLHGSAYNTRLKIENMTPSASMVNLGVLIWVNDTTHSAGDQFVITDVQLELGPVATEMERVPFETELLDCQRFYCQSYSYGTAPGTNTTAGLVGSGATGSGATVVYTAVRFPVTMRAVPTISLYGKAGTTNQFWNRTADAATANADSTSTDGFALYNSTNNSEIVFAHYTASAEL